MFFWRKRNEGFEWREYVRTTILVRRQERRQKIHDVKDAAVFGVKKAGQSGWHALADGAGYAGELAAQGFIRAWRGLSRFLAVAARSSLAGLTKVSAVAWDGITRGVSWAGRSLAPAFRKFGSGISSLLSPMLDVVAGERVRRPLFIIGAIAAVAAGVRSQTVGIDTETAIAGWIAGIVLFLAGLPYFFRQDSWRPVSALVKPIVYAAENAAYRLRRIPVRVIAGGLGIALVGTAAWYWLPAGRLSNAIETASVARTDPRVLDGRIQTLTGDSLKVGDSFVRLAGIEAPERDQMCTRLDGRTWKCGAAAKDALARLVRGRQATCTKTGDMSGEQAIVTCSADGKDIAEELVREGFVFATGAIFSGYAAIEDEAREAKRGLWLGEAQRPADYRAQKWDEAKRAAPDGCPIKGQVSGEGRVYVLPWTAAYDRVKIRAGRGDRWFCSEDEARAAGWRPTERL